MDVPDLKTDATTRCTLTSSPDEHQRNSRQWILRSAEGTRAGSAIVLGAGLCEEIPLAELAARFKTVVLNDSDAALLERAIADHATGASGGASIPPRPLACDLTGTTAALLATIDHLFGKSAKHGTREAVRDLLVTVFDAVPIPGQPELGQFDFIVASCLVSQLHVAVTQGAIQKFARQLPADVEWLREDAAWKAAVYRLARRIERTFVDQLLTWLAPGGRIYFSESVQMCYIEATPDGNWSTAGSYRMTPTTNLQDYFDGRFSLIAEGRWHWVVSPPQAPGDTGRLFDVQALVLERNEAAAADKSQQGD